MRVGSGTYALAFDAACKPRTPSAEEGQLATIRARRLIEGSLAAHAAQHMKKAQIAGLRNAVALMQHELEGGHLAWRGDRLLQVRIAAATEKTVLLRVVGEPHNPLAAQLVFHFETERCWRAALFEHRAVVDAIASRSPEATRAAMASHLANSLDRYMTSIRSTRQNAPAAPARRKPARKTA